ncbi:MAG: phosphatidylserine decarboxylase family protein [Bacteroidales bacterium]|nr:phosphatidylserine decarboxylase family protein [Bacteroidales bacterium]
MTLHKEGYKTTVIAIVLFALINIVSYKFIGGNVSHVILFVTGLTAFMAINFFRSPRRHFVTQDGAIIAPADGKVVVIEEVYEPEVLKSNALQVSIFMSPLNVHINWYPVAGLIKFSTHQHGNHKRAYLPKSSTENERSSVLIETKNGTQILARQIAGAMARRVVCYAEEGQQVEQSSQMGFIKFGSRVDLFLPIGTQIDVKLKDKTTGGQTILGWLK